MTLRVVVRALVEGATPAGTELVHYVATVHRVPMGEPFVAFDPERGLEGDAKLVREGEAVVLMAGALRPARVVAPFPLVLVQGLAKGDKCDAIVRDATELGATAVLWVAMDRSVARPKAEKVALREQRWRRIAEQAARQCGRGDAPRVEAFASLDAALEEAAKIASGRFVLWEGATEPLGPGLALALASSDARAGLAFVIGPEGGIDEQEIATCRAWGFEPASLGPFILRTETVAAAVLGAVRVMAGAPRR